MGSLASGVYGEPRLTHAIDVVLEFRPNQVAQLCAAFPPSGYHVREQAAHEAVAGGSRFNVIHPASCSKIDFMIARQDAWGRSQIRRRLEQILPGQLGYTAAPEDLIIGKLWYYREGGSEKHLRDVAAMLQVSGDEIDKDDISHWAQQLDLMEEWQAVLDRLPGRTRSRSWSDDCPPVDLTNPKPRPDT